MSLFRETIKAVRITALLWLLTAVLYPAVFLMIGLAVPDRANGSLILNAAGQPIGSALIGQPFTSDRYFWGRPSAIAYSTAPEVRATGVSGASNLAPGHPDLQPRLSQAADRLKAAKIQPTVDLIYASGSGLDPHISPEAALAQIDRIAAQRPIAKTRLETLIREQTDGRFLGLFGEPGVNVLKLNLAIDRLQP